jgi:Cft2 family RNA processing exonuclease
MRITPLGGAGEVGASCALVEVAGARLLIDAGVRVSASGQTRPLPAYERLSTPPDACIITHAHMDHTGSLPLAVEHLGEALIHMTVPTLHLLEVLQGDAARMAATGDAESDGRVRFDAEQVARAIARVEAHAYHAPFRPVPGRPDIVVEFAPCGHILGAAMVAIETPEEHILWTGDYSTERMPQPTIGGLNVDWVRQRAARRPFDLVVSEATYGTEVHQPRAQETARFLDRLEQTSRRGGKTLIPAFAVGRAQDILRVLRDAKLQGRLKGIPVYADGMVRPICSIYENLAHEFYPGIAEPLTLLDPDNEIYKANAQSRAKLCSDSHEGPAIVISSSGMLVGGRSVEYFKAFASGRKNTVLLSGYQDAEAPGGALLRIKRGGRMRLGSGEPIRVKCAIDRYRISAHADGDQIAEVIDAARPRKVGLVHADPHALEALRQKLGARRTVVLCNEQTFSMKGRPNRELAAIREEARTAPPAPPESPVGPMPTESQVRSVWVRLSRESVRDYSEAEISRLFLGPNYAPAEREVLSEHLSAHRLYFLSGGRSGQKNFRPRSEADLVDLLMERGRAFQVPLERGDVVVFCDGSSEQHLAIVDEVGRTEVRAMIPTAPRKNSFPRAWLRVRTGISLRREMDRGAAADAFFWLRSQIRDARAAVAPNPIEAYFRLRDAGIERVGPGEVLPALLNGRGEGAGPPLLLAAALALGNARALFSLESDGSFTLRDEAEAGERWKAFARVAFVRSLPAGGTVRLSNGRDVVPSGAYHADSFEIVQDDGTPSRCSYRRVLLPGEEAPASEPPQPMQPVSPPRERPRRPRRASSAGQGSSVPVASVADAPDGAPARRRRRRKGRAHRAAQAAAGHTAPAAVRAAGEPGAPPSTRSTRRRRGRRPAPLPVEVS